MSDINIQEGVRLQAKALTKRYGQREVLRHLQLSIEPGQFIAIVGRSGCGKSTLLRLVAGLEPLSEGQLLADGRPIEGLRDPCSCVGPERCRQRKAVRDQPLPLGLAPRRGSRAGIGRGTRWT